MKRTAKKYLTAQQAATLTAIYGPGWTKANDTALKQMIESVIKAPTATFKKRTAK